MTILNIDTLSHMIITNICQGQHLVAGQKGRYKRSDMYLVTYLVSNRDIQRHTKGLHIRLQIIIPIFQTPQTFVAGETKTFVLSYYSPSTNSIIINITKTGTHANFPYAEK